MDQQEQKPERKFMRQLPFLTNLNSIITSPVASPSVEPSSKGSPSLARQTSILMKEDVEEALEDLTANLKEGKYHKVMQRIQKFFIRNAHLTMIADQQISIYRRYFECMRKLTKRYFSQAILTQNQMMNIKKMCESGSQLISNWHLVLQELLDQKEIIESYVPPPEAQIPSEEFISSPLAKKVVSIFKSDYDLSKSPESSPRSPPITKTIIQRSKEMLKKQVVIHNIEFHIGEFVKSNFFLMSSYALLGKKTDNFELYRQSLFSAMKWGKSLESTTDEETIDNIGKTHLEIANYYMTLSSMKECIKNLDIAFEYMYKSLVLRGSTKKHLKLLKMPAKRKRRYQIKLLRNIVIIVCILYNLSIAEEYLDNFSRVLESLVLADWLSNVYLAQTYPELAKVIMEAHESAKIKYKELVTEEGEIYSLMNVALGLKDLKIKATEEDKIQDNDYYSFYNQILYDKYNVKELNQTQFISIPKRLNEIAPVSALSSPASKSAQQLLLPVSISGTPQNNLFSVGIKQFLQQQPPQKNISRNSMGTNGQSISQLNTRQSLVEESPSRYKEQDTHQTKMLSKNDSYSQNDKRILNQSSFYNQNQTALSSPLNFNVSKNSPQSAQTSRPASFKQTDYKHNESDEWAQGSQKGISLTSRGSTPNAVQRAAHNNNRQSLAMNNNYNNIQSGRLSNFKPDSRKVTTAHIIPKILTTDKYFDDSKAVFYSDHKDMQFFIDLGVANDEKNKKVAKKSEVNIQSQQQHHKSNHQQSSQKEQQPIIVQTLDEFFKEKLTKDLNRKNNEDTTNIEYAVVLKGVDCIKKDEIFDKGEFGQAKKLINFKVTSDQLFTSFRDQNTLRRNQPSESRAVIRNEFQIVAEDQISQVNLKLFLDNAKILQKEQEDQRRANQFIPEVTGQRDKQPFYKTQQEQKQNLNPAQMAKKVINLEIESVDAILKRESKEESQLRMPKDRRSSNSPKIEKHQSQYLESERSLSSKGKRGMSSHLPSKPLQIQTGALKFLDDYKNIAESTKMISQKRESKKASQGDSVIQGSANVQKSSPNTRKQLNSIRGFKDAAMSSNKKSSGVNLQQSTLPLRKLMKLKTSELMESNHDEKGKTPTDNNHGFTEASNVVLKTMQEENH